MLSCCQLSQVLSGTFTCLDCVSGLRRGSKQASPVDRLVGYVLANPKTQFLYLKELLMVPNGQF